MTPTTPRSEDMTIEPSLNVTPEGSLADIPTALERERESCTRGRTIRNLLRDNVYENS